jgi:hypothetical protein
VGVYSWLELPPICKIVLFIQLRTRDALSIVAVYLPYYSLVAGSIPFPDSAKLLLWQINVYYAFVLHLHHQNFIVDLNTICMCTFSLQVSDFGMSRLKHHTFLSSKSTAGTVIPLILFFNLFILIVWYLRCYRHRIYYKLDH